MKNLFVRAFVFTLVLTGFAASTVASRANAHNTSSTVAMSGPNGLPTPVCAPSDPTHCGMD